MKLLNLENNRMLQICAYSLHACGYIYSMSTICKKLTRKNKIFKIVDNKLLSWLNLLPTRLLHRLASQAYCNVETLKLLTFMNTFARVHTRAYFQSPLERKIYLKSNNFIDKNKNKKILKK